MSEPVATVPMPAAWLVFAADLLDLAAAKFSNFGCNDLEYPDVWTDDVRREFNRAVNGWNRDATADPDEAGRDVPDWMAMDFLAALIRVQRHHLIALH